MKIWRYVDLAKFVSMVATGTLYFPCATTELADPYEGWLPRSHIRALTEKLMRGYLEGMKQTRNAMQPGRHRAAFDAEIKHPQEKFDAELLREVCSKFGVSCWHINEGESAAMWQLYAAAGKGIAIESTRARLEGALHGHSIAVDQVQYMDFDTAEIEEDHDEPYLYALFIKRKSFAHEQELRATIPLSKPGIGTAVPCDMDALIAQIRIFPQARPYYADAVRYIVGGAHTKVTAPVVPSRLLGPPNY